MGDAVERLVALSTTRVSGYTRADGTKVKAHTRKAFETKDVSARDLKKNDYLQVGDSIVRVTDVKHGNDSTTTMSTVTPQGQKQTRRVSSVSIFKKIVLGLMAALLAIGVVGQMAKGFMDAGDWHEPAASISAMEAPGGDHGDDHAPRAPEGHGKGAEGHGKGGGGHGGAADHPEHTEDEEDHPSSTPTAATAVVNKRLQVLPGDKVIKIKMKRKKK